MIVAVIPAKEQSGRLPNKNMLEIEGEPMIARTIRYALASKRVDQVYVSTDSDAISAYAESLGAGIIRRGEELGGETTLIDVIRHAWRKLDNDTISHVVCLQPDHPDRTIDLDAAIERAMMPATDEVFTVDRDGIRNGSVRIVNVRALESQPAVWSVTMRDDCTNVHTPADFEIARRNILADSGSVVVNGRRIGDNEPTFVIAEAGGNHGCQIDIAERMIDLAAEAGVDAIKFQTYKAERLATRHAMSYWTGESISQIEHFRKTDRFGRDEYAHLFRYAESKGIIAFSTPFDLESASMLNALGMPLFKIASGDLPDKRLLRHVASFGKPVILSVGAATPEEIDDAVTTVFSTQNCQLILLSCTLSYPTAFGDANLRRILSLKERYPGITIGLSDHTTPDPSMIIPALAVALGAAVIEKHYTLDRSQIGSGHFFSANPEDLRIMVANLRLAEAALGSGNIGVLPAEEVARDQARRSIVAETAIGAGEIVTNDMVGIKRPGGGLSPSLIDAVIGRRARRDIASDESITLDMLE